MGVHSRPTVVETGPQLGQMMSECYQDPPQWQPPDIYNLADETDRQAVQSKLENGTITVLRDQMSAVAEELAERAYPAPNDEGARQEYTNNIAMQGEVYGNWVHFPWSGELVH